MPVNQDPVQITPYTSTVPLVQVPPDVISAQTRPDQPLQGQFGKKGTGALAIGDSLLKGFMLGHQMKEQRKAAQAQATINAADAASEAAYQQYQEALTNAGGKTDDPKAQAAYQAYVNAFQAGKQAKAQYVIPDKTQKGRKAAAGDTDPVKSPDDKKKKNPVSAGFNNIRDFFEANPHIVPQIALLTMQPKPPGLAPQGQEQVQNLESQKLANQQQQRDAANKQIYQTGYATYANLTPEEIEKLPPDAKKGYDAWLGAKAALTPLRTGGGMYTYKLPNGSLQKMYPEDAAAAGASLYVPAAQGKPGSEQAFFESAYKQYGVTQENAPPALQKYLNDYWRWKQNTQTTTATTTVNPQGDRTTASKRTAPPPPKPEDYGLPSGWAYRDQQGIQPPPTAQGQAPAATGGITKPPTAQASPTGQGKRGVTPPPQAAKTAKTGITRPPGGKQTWQTTQRAINFNTQRQNAYATAQKDYDNAVLSKKDANGNPIDPKVAATQLAAKKNSIDAAYRNQMRTARLSPGDVYVYLVDPNTGTSWQRTVPDEETYDFLGKYAASKGKQLEYLTNDEIEAAVAGIQKLNAADSQGGGSEQKSYAYTAKDAQGNQYGSDDGVHYFDVKNGKPYQEK